MIFTSAPEDIKNYILNFINIPEKITSENVKFNGRTISNLLCLNKEINEKMKDVCNQKLADLKKINELINKYSHYNDTLEGEKESSMKGQRAVPQGNPQLVDALSTGLGWVSEDLIHCFDQYTKEIENDIKEIVRLTPQSLKCNIGYLPDRYYYERLSPLAVACYNDKIPVHIIKYLLESGANPYQRYWNGSNDIPIIHGFEFDGSTSERDMAIRELFKEYALPAPKGIMAYIENLMDVHKDNDVSFQAYRKLKIALIEFNKKMSI